jgi:hypothetical protein
MRTAIRYKVDASKVTAKVTAELTKKRKDGKAQRRSAAKNEGKGGRLN